jgi:uncharacterized protein (TIGR03790 family)
MPMNTRTTLCLLVVAGAVATAGSTARGLSPNQVAIVANGNNADSVALAKAYAARRAIDERNIILLKTALTDTISRSTFNAQIRTPIRLAIRKRNLTDKIRCLCLIWGVPLRVAGPDSIEADKAEAAARTVYRSLHVRLATDIQLLATVGVMFPAPRTAGLTPLAELFPSPAPKPSEPLAHPQAVIADLHKLLAAKQVGVGRISDAARRKIATRQLMALHLDLRGLQGLLDHIRDNRPPDAPDVEPFQRELVALTRQLTRRRSVRANEHDIRQLFQRLERRSGIMVALGYAETLLARTRKVDHVMKAEAAVDSELALLWRSSYPLPGAAPNPLYWRKRTGVAADPGGPTLMVARIDGPTSSDAMRIIKASLAVEAEGLDGVFYIDAGGPNRVAIGARQQYDARFEALHRFVTTHTKVRCVLDKKQTLFPKDSCPHAALYCGWYSLQRYVPAFMWTPGAVGWHVASWEAAHLHDPSSQEWCVKMIQNGVAATIGAVSEPLLSNFPNPAELFPLLLTGKYTVAECYWRTVPAASWQMILIADPLYNPFKVNPQVKPSALPPGLAP